jgi:hypothetical protein
VAPLEEHGFTLVDFERDRIKAQLFKWDVNSQSPGCHRYAGSLLHCRVNEAGLAASLLWFFWPKKSEARGFAFLDGAANS